MTREEWESLLAFIRTLLKLQQKEQGDGTNASSANQEDPRMERLTQLFDAYTNAQLADCLTGDGTSPYGFGACRSVCAGASGYGQGNSHLRLLPEDSVRGFDCYVTEDGEHFETITTDGLGDPYNHGLRVFAETDRGLCIGTANPFYGTQLWRMNEVSTGVVSFTSNLEIDFDWQVTQYHVTAAPTPGYLTSP